MGVSNKQAITGTNSGELTEFFVAMSIIAKQTNSNLKDVYNSMSVQDGHVQGKHKNISFYGDGKMLLPYEEMKHFFAGNTTATVNSYIKQSEAFAHSYSFPHIDEIHNIGGSSGKDDVKLLANGERVKGISLKWGHSGIERSQGPSWNSTKALYSRFANIDALETEYEKRRSIFSEPAYRISKKQGDYSEELLNNGIKMIDTVKYLEKNIAESFVNKTIDPMLAAQGYVNSFTGTQDDIVLVELKSGKIVELNNDPIQELAKKIEKGNFSYTQKLSESGKTLTTAILLDDNEFITFQTTMSTDGAKNPNLAPGEENHLRTIKRQTYLLLNDNLVNSYEPGKIIQPVVKPKTSDIKVLQPPKSVQSKASSNIRCRAKIPANCKRHGNNADVAVKKQDINSYLAAKGF